MTTSFPTWPIRRSRPSWRPFGAIVLLPLEICRVVKEPLRAYVSARQHWDEGTVPGHVLGEVGNAALTIFNPLTMTYWVGVTSNWLAIAHSVLSYRT